MNNEKKQTDQMGSNDLSLRSNAAQAAVQNPYETAVLKALQEKASLLGKSYQYGGYQGL